MERLFDLLKTLDAEAVSTEDVEAFRELYSALGRKVYKPSPAERAKTPIIETVSLAWTEAFNALRDSKARPGKLVAIHDGNDGNRAACRFVLVPLSSRAAGTH